MDTLTFLLGIVVIVLATTYCIRLGIERHHQREMRAHELTLNAQNQRFILFEELIKQKALPPSLLNQIANRMTNDDD